MKTISKLAGIIAVMFTFMQCGDPLDKENLAAITGDLVWSNPQIAEAYVNDMYAAFMPGFDTGEFSNTDEGGGIYGGSTISAYIRGSIISNSYDYYPYDDIRRINIFLANINGATFGEDVRNSLKGQALFWRAWAYFRMVRAYGGVPLILEPAEPDDEAAIFVPRNKTSECFTQIAKDLDEAIRLLENKSDIGRIDKCAAMAFKGRVLLFKASPQFNRDNSAALWQEAYTANREALEFLDAQGKGLYDDYRNIWLDEMNREVIMVRRYAYPAASNGSSQQGMRPLLYSRGAVGGNVPSLELVNAYPMKDGSRWDPATMDYRKLHQNRDARFYASIACNGTEPYISPMFGNENLWTYWFDGDGDPSTGINGKESRADNNSDFGQWAENLFSYTGFYPAKMLDQTITRVTAPDGSVDWIEIRYAEVLMNYAEAASETGKTDEALNALYRIRQRAAIEPGDGSYGIRAASTEELRKVIQDERFVEFAFETKRFWDLRRWRIFGSTFNNMEDKSRHGLRIEYTGDVSQRPRLLTDINSVWDQFTVTVIPDFEPSNVLPEDKYSFFGIPTSVLDRNSKIEQNNTWEGTFNPLE
ncbi:MAG: RagB/SusD family nutrient uptake outer membrane protein [Tannerella sp.]|nr:RagB/SusD family nutrient uptake outer membrane protein [Tannerella sp.]